MFKNFIHSKYGILKKKKRQINNFINEHVGNVQIFIKHIYNKETKILGFIYK